MVIFSVAALALLVPSVLGQNMLRFACSQLVVERTDPIVFPGNLFTPHVHQIVGGNSFNITMDPANHDPATLSTCTSCNFVQDKSNYWTAAMYFKARNGSYHRVPQVGNGGPQGTLVMTTSLSPFSEDFARVIQLDANIAMMQINNGGLDVYYIPSGKTTAFAKGFRMIAGSATNTDVSKVNGANICHRCWTSKDSNTFVGGAPCTGSDTVEIPTGTNCQMIRQTIIFPACWNGKDLDSANHQDHVAYSGTGATGGGACPSAFPVKLPQVMYELMWDVSAFQDRNIWPTDGSNPFMYSMGIGGAAAHGDYLFGWENDTLQRAMDNGCNLNQNCSAAGLVAQSSTAYNACQNKQKAVEAVDGWLPALPKGAMLTA